MKEEKEKNGGKKQLMTGMVYPRRRRKWVNMGYGRTRVQQGHKKPREREEKKEIPHIRYR